MRNVENSRGLPAWSASSSSVTTPLPSTMRSRSGGLELGLAEEVVAARGLEVDQRAQDHPGRRRGDAADALEVGLALVAGEVLDDRAQVLGVEQRQVRWSAQWKISPSVDSCVSLRSSTLHSRIGPNCVSVARIGVAELLPPRREELDRVRRGRPVVAGVLRARLDLGRCPRPAAAIPDRSPLTSASSTGTPASDSCPASACSVFVLPVPVAPATRPCRLSVASGMPDPRRRDRPDRRRRRCPAPAPRPPSRTRRRCAAPRTSAPCRLPRRRSVANRLPG